MWLLTRTLSKNYTITCLYGVSICEVCGTWSAPRCVALGRHRGGAEADQPLCASRRQLSAAVLRALPPAQAQLLCHQHLAALPIPYIHRNACK